MIGEAVDVGGSELRAGHQIREAFEDDPHLLGQFPPLFLAAHVRSPFAGLYTG